MPRNAKKKNHIFELVYVWIIFNALKAKYALETMKKNYKSYKVLALGIKEVNPEPTAN